MTDREVVAKDWVDRFREVVDGLGIKKTIANKLANFIHYEIETAKIEALGRQEVMSEEEIGQALAQAYCLPNHTHKTVDPSLIREQVKLLLGKIPSPEKPFPKQFPISACCNASVRKAPLVNNWGWAYVCEACNKSCDLASDWNQPAEKPDYYYGEHYKEGVDPEITCWHCGKTFLCDCMDATCRLCNAPFDKSRCKEFNFKPPEKPQVFGGYDFDEYGRPIIKPKPEKPQQECKCKIPDGRVGDTCEWCHEPIKPSAEKPTGTPNIGVYQSKPSAERIEGGEFTITNLLPQKIQELQYTELGWENRATDKINELIRYINKNCSGNALRNK
jgi:hypothetical protein